MKAFPELGVKKKRRLGGLDVRLDGPVTALTVGDPEVFDGAELRLAYNVKRGGWVVYRHPVTTTPDGKALRCNRRKWVEHGFIPDHY